MIATLRWFIVCLLLSVVGSTGAFAKSAKLFDIQCKSDERATGCLAPYNQCEFGTEKDVIATCRLSAKYQRCPDFGWEKCCAANCYIRADRKVRKMGKCMEECTASPLGLVFWPKAPNAKK